MQMVTPHSHSSTSEKTATTLLGFILGAAAGVAAGMLLAPKSGEESRLQLKQKAQETRGKVQDRWAPHKEDLGSKIDDVSDKVTDKLDQAKDAAHDAVDNTHTSAAIATEEARRRTRRKTTDTEE